MAVAEAMIKVCRTFTYNLKSAEFTESGIVFPEPYIPYIPDRWNGLLVLSEAQDLSKANSLYVDRWKDASPSERINRLYSVPGEIGIPFWDDGYVKLALKAASVSLEIDKVAVGGAIPWSRVSESGRAIKPSSKMMGKAVNFWREIFKIWEPSEIGKSKPKLIVTLGKTADRVIRRAKSGIPTFNLNLPSQRYLRQIGGMFDYKNMLLRFPEVRTAILKLEESYPEKGSDFRRHEAVFYACHAVSKGAERFRDLF